MGFRIGLDLVAVRSVVAALEAPHGDQYLARVYTPAEVADCRTDGRVDAERLAARFAAKEAALKVLSASDEGVSWQAIEVVRSTSGEVRLALHGRAAELAAAVGIVDLALSLTHEDGMAAAVVVAELAGGERSGGATH